MRLNLSQSLFVVVIGFCSCAVLAQDKEKVSPETPLTYKAIRQKLIFRSRVRETDAEISRKVLTEVARRKVDFVLTPEEADSLKAIGASKELIEAIKSSVPKERLVEIERLNEMTRLYNLYTDNFYKKTEKELKIAIEAGKEFIRRYKNDPEVKTQVDYLKSNIPILCKWLYDRPVC